MKTKHKRLMVVGICVAWGMLVPLSEHLLPNDFWCYCAGEYDQLPLLKKVYINIYWYTISFTSKIQSSFYPKVSPFPGAVVQFIIYIFIGIVISFAAYSPFRKKAEPHEEATAEGGQD